MDTFGKNYGKRKTKSIDDDIELMFEQILKEIDFHLKNIESKMNSLWEEAKSKLKKGDKSGSKKILIERKLYTDVMNSIKETIQLLEEQKAIFYKSNNNEEIINIIKQINSQIKEKNDNINDNIVNVEEPILQAIENNQLNVQDIESQSNALHEEAKSKLKLGDKNAAKNILRMKKELLNQLEDLRGNNFELKAGFIKNKKESFDEMNDIIKQANQQMIEKIQKNIVDNLREKTEKKKKNLELVEENNKLKKVIDQWKQENLKTIQKLEKENKEKKEKINTLENEIQNIMTQDRNLNENVIISNRPGEKIISVNFMTMSCQDIMNYSMPCKNTDLFVRLEERLYNDFPKYKNNEVYFAVNTRRIKRFKTIEENNIKSNDIISIFIIEE